MSDTCIKKKAHIMQLIFTLDYGGAERLAVMLSGFLNKDRYEPSVCGVFGCAGPLVDDLDSRSIPYYYLEGEKRGKASLFYKLYRLFVAQKVDIVQVHGAYLLLFCFLPAKLAGVKIVYTEHAKHSILNKKLVKFAAQYLSRFSSKVVCVSNNLKKFFEDDLNIHSQKLQVVHNGIDIDKFKCPLPSSANKNSDVLVGCVARLTEAKDHKNLLLAFSFVIKSGYKVKLLIVGGGHLQKTIEEEIVMLGISQQVEMLGPRDDIPNILSSIDIFVLPSRREGFPVSILEAMAAGCSVIATDVGGVSEVIDSGINGLIVAPENPDLLAEAIISLVDCPEKRNEIAINGQSTACDRFDLACTVDAYSDIFEDIIRVYS
jgi:glycosyltransferase involved in cell wall biosynthesis